MFTTEMTKVVICTTGSAALQIVSIGLQEKGCEVIVISSMETPVAHRYGRSELYFAKHRPETLGLVARLSHEADLLIDGWGLPEEFHFRGAKLDVSYQRDVEDQPEVDAASVLLSIAGSSESVILAAPPRPALKRSSRQQRTLQTSNALANLGLESSQIAHLAAERVI